MNRREFLEVSAISAYGVSVMDLEAAKELWGPSKEGKAKNVIVIYMSGGMAHQESFDPKYLLNSVCLKQQVYTVLVNLLVNMTA